MDTWFEASVMPSAAAAALAFAIWAAEKLLTPKARILPARASFAISPICAPIDEMLQGMWI